LCGAPLDSSEALDLKLQRLKSKRRGVIYRFVAVANKILTALSPRTHPRRGLKQPPVPHRDVSLAAVFGAIPGLGQIYNRQLLRGAVLFVAFALTIWLAAAAIHSSASNWFAVAALLVMLYSIQDAASGAMLINGSGWTARKSLAVVFYFVFLVGIVASLSQIAVLPLFRVVHITHDALAPTLRKGDYVLVDSLALRFRKPRRGEIVFYHPTRGFRIAWSASRGEKPVAYYIISRNTFERVIGFPQDVVEKRRGTLYLNGKTLDESRSPLVRDQILARIKDFSLEIPKDHYGIILSSVAAEEAGIYRAAQQTAPANGSPHTPSAPPSSSQEVVQREEFRIPIAESSIGDNWLEACLVNNSDILGRPLAIVHPPKRRSLVR
jgi:signal peptidase I